MSPVHRKQSNDHGLMKELFQSQIDSIKDTVKSVEISITEGAKQSREDHERRHQEVMNEIKDVSKDIPEMKRMLDNISVDIYGDSRSGVSGMKKKVEDLFIWKVSFFAVIATFSFGGYFIAKSVFEKMARDVVVPQVQTIVDSTINESVRKSVEETTKRVVDDALSEFISNYEIVE